MKTRFLARFLLAFALLIPLGALVDFSRLYSRALEGVTAAFGPALSGWSLEHDSTARSGLRFRRGTEFLPLQLSLEALALGLLPLLSLIAATPGMAARRRALAIALGVAGLFALDLVVLLAYPWMVRNPNALKDIVGTYLGLLTFVGGPVILWFALTFRELAAVWRLSDRGA